MSASAVKKTSIDQTRIGDYAAMQPVSGILSVDATTAVNGLGRGAFVRKEEAEKRKA